MEEKNRGGIPIQPVSAPKSAVGEAVPSAAFTPGPWAVRLSHPNEGFDCFWIDAVRGGRPTTVATADGYQHQPERQANARLIAAAPELYEVCREFIGKLGRDGYYPTAGKPLTDKMRAAIAKAEAYNAS